MTTYISLISNYSWYFSNTKVLELRQFLPNRSSYTQISVVIQTTTNTERNSPGYWALWRPCQFQSDSLLQLLLQLSHATWILGTFLSNQSNNTKLTVTYLYSCATISTANLRCNLSRWIEPQWVPFISF